MVKLIDEFMLKKLKHESNLSTRRRQHLNLHASHDEPCQRLLNFINFDSYIRPHKHNETSGNELLICIKGALSLLIFDVNGSLLKRYKISSDNSKYFGNYGVEILPDTWHTVISETEYCVILEVKSGPYIAQSGKQFAPWAPEESSSDALRYFMKLRNLKPFA